MQIFYGSADNTRHNKDIRKSTVNLGSTRVNEQQ